MTCREKLKMEHPENIDEAFGGGCFGCPSMYSYITDPYYCDNNSHTECTRCWDREIPSTEPIVTEPTTPTEHDAVNHPSHYTNGGMECIDEMILVFGTEAVAHFCLCNAWKYRRRAMYKNGEEDMNKSHWYINKYRELVEEWDKRTNPKSLKNGQ